MITSDLIKEYQFQRQHGGGWVGHDAEQAIRGARAYLTLQDAIDAGVAAITWEEETYPDASWMDASQLKKFQEGLWVSLWCAVEVEGAQVASLGGITVTDHADPYCHIIESELALEALDALTDALSGIEDLTDVAY